MSSPEPLIRNISDTALWVAVYRARESERPDALFRDPLARRLAGERGEQIAKSMPFEAKDSWPFVARTLLGDELVARVVKQGADMVINLAAGLDARPYRMMLPAALQWVEVDLPEILDYKEKILAQEQPVCRLERVRLDLKDVTARRELFARLAAQAKRVLIMTEGLLTYLSPEEVGQLATDLAAPPSFKSWVLEVASPGLMKMLNKKIGDKLSAAGAPFKFAPTEGPEFFTKYGWKPVEVRGMLKTAAQLKRLPFFLSLMAKLPESSGAQGNRPWSAICLCVRQG